jgi:hypothetical protein
MHVNCDRRFTRHNRALQAVTQDERRIQAQQHYLPLRAPITEDSHFVPHVVLVSGTQIAAILFHHEM